MLVTLGNNTALSAGASNTLPYACNSVQKVYIKVDDDSTSRDFYVTVQLGQRTLVNGASGMSLVGFQGLQGGHNNDGSETQICIDLGSHQLLDNENLYVTVRAGAAALTAVDVSAIVNEPSGGEYPVRYTEYSDNTFTAENVLSALIFKDDASAIDEDGSNVEIRDAVSSSSPSIMSAVNWFGCTCFDNGFAASFGLLKKSSVPLTTTFNYPSGATANRIIVASLMGTNRRAIRQGQQANRLAQYQVGK